MPSRLAIVVKYFPPYPRISGVLTYLSLLAARLGETDDVHVVTSALPPGTATGETVPSCTVHRVGRPFPLTSAGAVRRIRPDVTLTVSGFYDLRAGAVYFLPGLVTNPTRRRHHLYQATWPAAPPGLAYRTSAARYGGVLAASEGIADLLAGRGVAARALPPAVDVARLAGARPHPRPGPLRIGFVNHLNEVKGADHASEAMVRLAAALPDAEFVVAGRGDLEEDLRRRHEGRPRFTVLGFLEEAERIELLASCDVQLLPFRQATSVLGVSQTALEVLAAGNVVVGTATASLSGAVEHDRNGLLVPPEGDVAGALVDAVLGLAADPARLDRLRRAAADDAAGRWDIGARAAELRALLGIGTGT